MHRVFINQASCCNIRQLIENPGSAMNGFLFKREATSTFSKSPPPDGKTYASKRSQATDGIWQLNSFAQIQLPNRYRLCQSFFAVV
jgi:hypothetical protein